MGRRPADTFLSLPSEEIFDGLVECIWRLQMGDVPDIRQLNESRARNRLSSLFRELGDIPKISAQINRRTIFTQRSMIFLTHDQQGRHLNLGELVANRLLIDHESR